MRGSHVRRRKDGGGAVAADLRVAEPAHNREIGIGTEMRLTKAEQVSDDALDGCRHHPAVLADELEVLLAEQVAYYRAHALEYDINSPWPHDKDLRATFSAALDAFQPRGDVLELACGPGVCTKALAAYAARLDAVDVSPEMLAIASARVPQEHVHFIESDIFGWQPARAYDVVFFSAWLSHVPPQRFEPFWALVGRCLKQDGRVFFIDELPAEAAYEQLIPGAIAPAVERPLESGARYRVVKVFHTPDELREELAKLGWDVMIHTIGWRFYYATGTRR